MALWQFILPCLLTAAGLALASRRLAHYFQLESYQFYGYFRTVCRQWKKAVAPYLLLCICLGAAWLAYTYVTDLLGGASSVWTGLLPLCALALIGGLTVRRQAVRNPEKKKFAVTARMKRLYLAHFLVSFLILLGVEGLLLANEDAAWRLAVFPAQGFLPMLPFFALLPLLFALSALCALPVERLIFRLYFRDAEKKLLENDRLIRIGITGSYGKTSTKFILAEILSQKYNVLATPASFNTPMGVTRIIRERLTPAHQVFIGEMGARHVGEIKELCRLVHPTVGLLTAIGPQHLDTFKTIERIKSTKYELIDALPADGLAVFQHDGALVTECCERTKKKKLLVGAQDGDAWAENVTVSGQGSDFLLCLRGWEPIPCHTRLLGEHNIKNILMAAATARALGLTREEIMRGVAALRPVEHRLQLLHSMGDVTVIDDAFNTNPRSSKAALDVLSSFPGRRIVVTPGMVELGGEEEKYNREFGEYMARRVDIAVLVGKKHTAPIREGLLAAGFREENIHTVNSLNEAIALNKTLLRPGDVVMYENDLPDHYSEG